jgi:hypothetical protein
VKPEPVQRRKRKSSKENIEEKNVGENRQNLI